MRPRSAAILACRIIALVMGIEVVTAVVSFLAFAPGLEGSGPFWAMVGTRAVIAWVLWIGAEGIAGAIARGTVDEGVAVAGRTANVATVAFAVVGLILITEALTGFAATLATSSGLGFGPESFGRFSVTDFPFAGTTRAAVIIEMVTLGIGLLLMIGAGDLARWNARRYPEPEPSDTTTG